MFRPSLSAYNIQGMWMWYLELWQLSSNHEAITMIGNTQEQWLQGMPKASILHRIAELINPETTDFP